VEICSCLLENCNFLPFTKSSKHRANIEQTSSKHRANIEQTLSWLVQLTRACFIVYTGYYVLNRRRRWRRRRDCLSVLSHVGFSVILCNVELWSWRDQFIPNESARRNRHSSVTTDMAWQLWWQGGRMVPRQDRSRRHAQQTMVKLNQWIKAKIKANFLYFLFFTFCIFNLTRTAKLMNFWNASINMVVASILFTSSGTPQ